MNLLLASNNAHKVAEICAILGDTFSHPKTLKEAGVVFEAVEDGATFQENACKKAEETLAYVGARFDAVLADDSGLAVDALCGAPGVHSARFSGEAHNDARNNAYLMECLQDVPDAQRTAQFCCCLALARRGRPTVCVLGVVHGSILRAPRGENGFGYDPYFWYAPLKKSFAELTADEKNAISHRHNALLLLKEALLDEDRGLL